MKSPNRGRGERSLLNVSGKGDKDRTTDNKAFSRNFLEIDFGGSSAAVEGFVHSGGKQRKVYAR